MNKNLIIAFSSFFFFFNSFVFAYQKETPIIEAVKERDEIGLNILMDNAFSLFNNPSYLLKNPLNAQDSLGNTALHYACLQQDQHIFNALIENDASLFIRNKEGQYPLDFVLKSQNKTMIEIVGSAMTKILSQEAELFESRWATISTIWGSLIIISMFAAMLAHV